MPANVYARAAAVLGCTILLAGTVQSAEKTAPPKTAQSQPAATTRPSSIYDLTVADIDGKRRSLREYEGKVLLVVNVASRCGFTPQYTGLEELYRKYKDRGLVVLGVPSNDFGRQEPGTNAQIKEFCSTKFHTTFPMLSKISVKNGPEQHRLYNYLTSKMQNGVLDTKIAWNFNKILIGRDGRPIRHYESKVKPDDENLRADIEKALSAKPPASLSADLPSRGG